MAEKETLILEKNHQNNTSTQPSDAIVKVVNPTKHQKKYAHSPQKNKNKV